MTQIEQIRAEIERRIDAIKDKGVREYDGEVCGLKRLLSFIESQEKDGCECPLMPKYKPCKDYTPIDTPKIKGWVARDIHGTLRLYGNDAADGMGIRTGELPSPYKELTAEDEPIEVELEIHRV